jgi:rSAM/selenodomain-associated transferase 2
MTRSDPGLSVVVPVLDDAEALERLVGRLRAMPESPDEIVVVDGAGDPVCARLCTELSVIYICTPPGRGVQLDAGARATTGGWLWFLHADASPPSHSARLIRRALSNGANGGWFRFSFTGTQHATARILSALINLRCRFGTPYGDQGLFMTAQAYRGAGGFPHVPLFEEVPLVRALRRRGRFRALPVAIGVNPRRWKRDGWWRRSLMNRRLALAYMMGASPERLARDYRRPMESQRT